MNIGEKIKDLRQSKMMTQQQLAGDMITRNMLSRIENGAALPSVPTVVYLADRLNIPAGYLLADDKDAFLYQKISIISDIKKAYSDREFLIARSLCSKLSEIDESDDEINYIISECDFGIATDAILSGNLHNARRYLDESLEYAKKTVYRTSEVESMCRICFRYIGKISPTLNSDIIDDVSTSIVVCNDIFCNYILALEGVENGAFDSGRIAQDTCTEFFQKHIEIKRCMKSRNNSEALKRLDELFVSVDKIPPTVLYDIYCDFEECFKNLDDYHGAYDHSNNKMRQLEKLLSGD